MSNEYYVVVLGDIGIFINMQLHITFLGSNWYGLSASSGVITKFSLGTNDMAGTIPTEIGLLTDLTYIRMSKNTLTGNKNTIKFKITLYTCSHSLLVVLTLLCVGTLPTQFGMLSDVKYVRMDSNTLLSGRIPCWFGTMTQFDGSNNFDFKL